MGFEMAGGLVQTQAVTRVFLDHEVAIALSDQGGNSDFGLPDFVHGAHFTGKGKGACANILR